MKLALQKAVERMTMNLGNGDICIGPTELGFQIDDKDRIIIEGDSDRPYPFLLADFYGEKWEIIPAKLKPAPESEKVYPALEIASACMKSNGRFGDPTSFDVSLVTEGDKNGYLKRDLELRPFLKAVEKLCSECEQKEIHDVEWGMVNAVLIEFKNLKPLKAE